VAKRLGELLLEENLVTAEHIQKAIEEQQKTGEPLGRILVHMNFITEEALFYFLAIQFGTEYVELDDREIKPEVTAIIKKELAQEFNVIPLEENDKQIIFATSEPDVHLISKIRDRAVLPAGKEISFVVASETALRRALGHYYGVTDKLEIDDSMKDIFSSNKDKSGVTEDEEEEGAGVDEEKVNEESAPVIRLVNALISEAVRLKASDIHLNPMQKGLVVRYRIDGSLQKQPSPPRQYKNPIVSRIKVMAKMDIMEKRAAQDGRIKIKVQNKVIDLRVSVLPSIYGENVVMRILDQGNLMLDLTKLGFEQKELDIYSEVIQSPYGLILHTGPTGSGKTTTLYSALSTVNDVSKCIMTMEDPVEYQLPGIIQIQMNSDIGLTFAAALRSALRQDPNIIMVGEIRDKKTADIAIQAALTGHLIFSTIHTNDAPSTIMRLIDMGVDPVYVGSALKLVVAQRLMRKVCTNCKKPFEPTDDDLQILQLKRADVEGARFFKGEGCPKCGGSGYKGRLAVYEIMKVDQKLSDLIFARADLNEIRIQAIKDGMRTLRTIALEKWKNGITSMEEVIMATSEE
jgi:type IV pilus assembly protein PilB